MDKHRVEGASVGRAGHLPRSPYPSRMRSVDPATMHGRRLSPLHRATRAGDALDTLLRLFVIGLPVSSAAARRRSHRFPSTRSRPAVSPRSTATTRRHGSRCDRSVAPSAGSWPTTCHRRAVARSPPTTCWASARRRWRSPGRPSVTRSAPPSTSAAGVACRRCTRRRTAHASSRPTSTRGRSPSPR